MTSAVAPHTEEKAHYTGATLLTMLRSLTSLQKETLVHKIPNYHRKIVEH